MQNTYILLFLNYLNIYYWTFNLFESTKIKKIHDFYKFPEKKWKINENNEILFSYSFKGDCRLPMRPGYSKLKFQQGETKWFFNMTSKQCEPFEYFGRGGNGNRFRTPIHCLRRCGCKVQQDPGHCTNFTFPVIRYAYNSMWRFCSEFEYYGCGGNMNNFATFFECQLGCGGGIEF